MNLRRLTRSSMHSRPGRLAQPLNSALVLGLALGLVGCAWAAPEPAAQVAPAGVRETPVEHLAIDGEQATPEAVALGRGDAEQAFVAPFLEARLALAMAEGGEVLPKLQALVQKDNCPAEVFATIAEIHAGAEEYAKAVGVIELGIKRHPENADLHIEHARLLRQMSKLDEAIGTAELALKYEPHRQEALELLSEIHLQRLRQVTSEDQLAGQVKALINVYERMLETRQGTDRLPPLLILTSLHQRTGNPTRALEFSREAVELSPREVRTHLALGTTLEEQGQTTEALAAYRQGLLIEPANSDLRERVDAVLKSAGDDARVDFYEQMARDFPNVKEVQDQAGRLLVQAGRWPEAETRLAHINATWPDDPHARLALVRVWLALGKNEEAVRETEKLIAENHELAPLVALSVGDALLSAGQPDRALTLVRTLQERRPNDEMLTLGLATLLDQGGRGPDAIDLLQGYFKLHPESFKTVALLSELLSEARRYPEAHQLLETLPDAMKVQNADEVTALRAQLLQNEKKLPEAYALMGELLRKFPANPQFQVSAGYLNQLMGKNGDAERYYREALRLSPSDPEISNTLGYFLAQTNQKLDEAQQLVSRALEQEPEAAHIIDSMGWVLYQRGDYAGALEHLERATRLMKPTPDSAEVWDHLAETYLKLNRPEDARAAWKRALELNPSDEAIRGKLDTRLNAAKQ